MQTFLFKPFVCGREWEWGVQPVEMTGGLDNSSLGRRVRFLGNGLETTRSLRDCGSLTALSAFPLPLPLAAL